MAQLSGHEMPAVAKHSWVWAAGAAVVSAGLVLLFPKGAVLIGGLLVVVAGVAFALKRPEFLLVGLLGASALDTSGRLADVAGAQITVYQVVFFGSVCVYGWLIYKHREQFRSTVANWWVLLLALAGLVAIPGAVSPLTGIVAWLSLVSSMALVYLVVGLAYTPERLRLVMNWFLFIAATLSVFAAGV